MFASDIQNLKKEPSCRVRNQYLAGVLANIISASYGAFVGWTSASFLEMQSLHSSLDSGPISDSEASWIGSILCLGGAVGTVFFTWCANSIGRKRCLLLISLPALLGWWIIPFSRNAVHLSISRFAGGFAGGGAFAVIPVFTAEISEDRIRGILGTFLILSCNVGVLLAFILGYFYSYVTVAWMLSTLPFAFLIFFVFVHDTPQYLASINRLKDAERSLCYYRLIKGGEANIPSSIKSELNALIERTTDSSQAMDEKKVTFADFYEEKSRKALIIGIVLMVINQACGCFAMLNYTSFIFQQSGSDLHPNLCAIIVGIIQLLGSYVSVILVEKAGRKLLLVVSAIGTGLGLVSLGCFSLLGQPTTPAWGPVASFSFVIFMACCGVIPLPIVVLSEILPPKARSLGCMICMLFLWLFSFFVLKYLGAITELIGLHGLMFLFAVCTFLGVVFVIALVPETKGKSIDEIMHCL